MSFVILRKIATNWTDLIGSGINEFPTEGEANDALEELKDGVYKIVPTDELGNYDLIA
jgi:hypothetical protein